MISIIALTTLAALLLYILFGGADYGAGILELFASAKHREEQRHAIQKAIGPVWEVNHIWLILLVVIFFNGFPPLYLALTTSLHIPILAVLVGVVLRGVMFTCRHYDTFPGTPQRLYTAGFGLSSLWTSVWLGIVAGACASGRINPAAQDFAGAYLAPWFHSFSLAMGLFVASVFAYLAASFLVAEATTKKLKDFFVHRALIANLCVVLSGGLVFLAAELSGLTLARDFFRSPESFACLAVATVLWGLQIVYRRDWNVWHSRAFSALQVALILLGYFLLQWPVIIQTVQGPLTLANSAAPDSTLFQLVIALIVGLLVILPGVALLFWVFKFNKRKK